MLKSVFLIASVILAGCSCGETGSGSISEGLIDGDIVLRRGRGAKSQAVLRADREGEYSHAGMAVMTDSGIMVVHAVPGETPPGESVDRIKAERPEEFFTQRRASRCAVLRLRDTTGAAHAARYVTRAYRGRVEFDHDYDLEDSTRLYCTELLWRAYLDSGVDITAGRRGRIHNFPLLSGTYIFPSHFHASGLFEEIRVFISSETFKSI